MRVLLQRVAEASVSIEKESVASIDSGLLLLVGVTAGDTEADVDYLTSKIANLRIFADADGHMNVSALDISAEVLVVSQFTLYANIRKGRRPSFAAAAAPAEAERIIELFIEGLHETGLQVQTGCFGANMQVGLVNDGPVTIWLDSAELRAG